MVATMVPAGVFPLQTMQGKITRPIHERNNQEKRSVLSADWATAALRPDNPGVRRIDSAFPLVIRCKQVPVADGPCLWVRLVDYRLGTIVIRAAPPVCLDVIVVDLRSGLGDIPDMDERLLARSRSLDHGVVMDKESTPCARWGGE